MRLLTIVPRAPTTDPAAGATTRPDLDRGGYNGRYVLAVAEGTLRSSITCERSRRRRNRLCPPLDRAQPRAPNQIAARRNRPPIDRECPQCPWIRGEDTRVGGQSSAIRSERLDAKVHRGFGEARLGERDEGLARPLPRPGARRRRDERHEHELDAGCFSNQPESRPHGRFENRRPLRRIENVFARTTAKAADPGERAIKRDLVSRDFSKRPVHSRRWRGDLDSVCLAELECRKHLIDERHGAGDALDRRADEERPKSKHHPRNRKDGGPSPRPNPQPAERPYETHHAECGGQAAEIPERRQQPMHHAGVIFPRSSSAPPTSSR